MSNFQKIRIWWKYSKNIYFVKIFEYVDFGDDFEISRFWSKFSKLWIVDKIFGKSPFASNVSNHLDFGQIFEKSQFMSNFRKIRIFVNILQKWRFWSKSLKVSIFAKPFEIPRLVKIFLNLSFGQNFRKIANLGKIGEKLVKFFDKFRFIRNISILIRKSNNLDFGQFFLKSWLKWKLSKYLDFDQNRQK